MDDLKHFAKIDKEIEDLNIVKEFSFDIVLEFWLDKCGKATFKAWKTIKAENTEIDTGTAFGDLDKWEV